MKLSESSRVFLFSSMPANSKSASDKLNTHVALQYELLVVLNSNKLSTHMALQYELLVVLKVVHDAHVRAAVHDGLPEAIRQVENWNVSVQAVGPDNVLGREKMDQNN